MPDENIQSFDRKSYSIDDIATVFGNGEIGGKAQGLAFIKNVLESEFGEEGFDGISVNIPRMAVISTDVFDLFMNGNNLYEIALSDVDDVRIAHAFLKADFPVRYVGDLMEFAKKQTKPLAVRSSSMLEDALYHPFGGVYATKMIPNNAFEPNARFQKLVEAIKFVWASTFFREAKTYLESVNQDIKAEKMAVILQEVMGDRYGDRFYPIISGVGRSYNYYPTGSAKPEDGVVDLAFGLGKTIVDGGVSWNYSPAYPKATPPFSSVDEMMKLTQVKFWSVNMGTTNVYDPARETEYMLNDHITDVEKDGSLKNVCSTFIPASNRVVPGTGPDGPRIVNFAPVLTYNEIKLNDLIKKLLHVCDRTFENPVEIEFALGYDKNSKKARLGFVQVRPMLVSKEKVEISNEDEENPNLLIKSARAMGNGIKQDISDIVYVRPEVFEAKFTPKISAEIEQLNKLLVNQNRPYLLMGFGRWGSSDPWLGIPVNWSQISGASVIVESTLPNMRIDLSQGSHFFHNLTSFSVMYFSIHHFEKTSINWDSLQKLTAESESDLVRHIALEKPLQVKVDGRIGKGVVLYG